MKNKKIIISSYILASLLSSVFCVPYFASAFESSSTSFELHAGDLQSVVASSSGATFQLQNAAGQTATASSSLNNTSISSGILYWLFGWFTARYDQMHYRWRNDDGAEDTATFSINIDTQHIDFPKDTKKRLRFEVSNEGWTRASFSPVFQIQVAELSSGATNCATGPFASAYAAIPATPGSSWMIATSTNVTDGNPTTNVAGALTDENRTFVAGQIKDTGNVTSAIPLTSSEFTEIEFSLLATSAATNGATYCFRLTNNGSTTNFAYSNYAKAQLQSGLPATGTLDSAVFDTINGGGIGKGAAFNSIMWRGSQNGSLGKVQFQFATSDCPNGQTNYPTCSTGSWSFIGGATCDVNNYYDAPTPAVPVEITCSPLNHNNQRYYRYRIRLCSAGNCTDNGLLSPIVDDVVVNWAP